MIERDVKYTITLNMQEFDTLISNIDEILYTFTVGDPEYVWGQDEVADNYYRRHIDSLNNFKLELLKVAVCEMKELTDEK